MNTPQVEEWHRACKSEIKSLEDNKVWLLVDNPDDGSTIIKGRWVFKIKRDKDGNISRYKAR